MEKFCRLAINAPLKQSILTYKYQENLDRGDLVEVPLGRRKAKGVILEVNLKQSDLSENELKYKIKEVENKISLSIGEEDLKLYQWISNYYHYPLGQLIFESLPKILKRPRDIEVIRGLNQEVDYDLTSRQVEVLDNLSPKITDKFSQSLIHGVTGSGKTAIYLELMKKALSLGKSIHFLVPEINLTPQFLETFSQNLGCPIYSYHSSVKASQKFQLWNLADDPDHEPFLLIGVRSSVFVPIKKLGLIIVDEEHDSSFKQDDRCRYNARDIAIKKSSLLSIPIVLGTATPTLETFNRFHKKEGYFSLEKRAVEESKLPEVQLIDISTSDFDESWPIHPDAIKEIKESLELKEQVLIFINRLGFSRYVQCSLCKHKFMCPNCSVNLTYFKDRDSLSCHYCNYKERMHQTCPECGSLKFFHQGFGTQRVVEVLKKHFETNSIERFDRDELSTFKDISQRLDDFHQGKIDILVGTQMLSKGHNFKKVNLVIILGIDNQLNFPDFRSSEKVYQQLVQVAGRSGRYSDRGKVIVQTFHPESELFQWVKERSFYDFYLNETQMRQMLSYPPFCHLAVFYFNSRFSKKLVDHIEAEARRLKNFIDKEGLDVSVLGPTSSLVEKKVNKFTWYFIIKSEKRSDLHRIIRTFDHNYEKQSSVEVKIDVDPMNII